MKTPLAGPKSARLSPRAHENHDSFLMILESKSVRSDMLHRKALLTMVFVHVSMSATRIRHSTMQNISTMFSPPSRVWRKKLKRRLVSVSKLETSAAPYQRCSLAWGSPPSRAGSVKKQPRKRRCHRSQLLQWQVPSMISMTFLRPQAPHSARKLWPWDRVAIPSSAPPAQRIFFACPARPVWILCPRRRPLWCAVTPSRSRLLLHSALCWRKTYFRFMSFQFFKDINQIFDAIVMTNSTLRKFSMSIFWPIVCINRSIDAIAKGTIQQTRRPLSLAHLSVLRCHFESQSIHLFMKMFR